MSESSYNILIVGAGIAGSALAHALSASSPLPKSCQFKIALLERSLAEPDRIVGELLQPGGVSALKTLGLRSCLDNIGAISVHGYCVVYEGKTVHIPYPGKHEGRSFHHGRLIQALRAKAKEAEGVDVIEANVTELVECTLTHRVLGVRAKRPGHDSLHTFFADVVIIADGCLSNFRNKVMRAPGTLSKRIQTKSHFIGSIVEDAKLPIPEHGTVVLIPGSGPVLLYQIEKRDTRILMDIKAPLPPDLPAFIRETIIPALPSALHIPVDNALKKNRLRKMPNSFLPPMLQGGDAFKDGVFLLGDAWNMRHPLTGGGMTVALNDVVVLAPLILSCPDISDPNQLSKLLERWHWSRKPLASTVNILSVALYDLFGADDDNLAILREGCFKYFELGGDCINGPVSLLSGIAPSPSLLARHFFAVAIYSIWTLFTHSRAYPSKDYQKGSIRRPNILEYPGLAIRSVVVFWTACVVFGPLVWSELRWW
ncbi:squalene epoxidase-domain-containing protein [Hysterangium stoloniferum]|nr:squalene epoxidase-domain-containing protein [Hysterangium stoloniferum]